MVALSRCVARGNRISRKQPPRQRPKIEGAYGGGMRRAAPSACAAPNEGETERNGTVEEKRREHGRAAWRGDTALRTKKGRGRWWIVEKGSGDVEGCEKERRPARTILINPVPGSRSRSNRVHDLQGIYIRSSTRGYNSIPSFYSARSALEPGPPRTLSSLFLLLDPGDTNKQAQSFRSRRGFSSSLILASIEDSELSASWLLASNRAHIVLRAACNLPRNRDREKKGTGPLLASTFFFLFFLYLGHEDRAAATALTNTAISACFAR